MSLLPSREATIFAADVDGTCPCRSPRPGTPRWTAPCPDVASAAKLPAEELSQIACDWAAACGRSGEEGCCVGCSHPFAAKLDRGCALRALRQRSCADVVKIVDAPGCLR